MLNLQYLGEVDHVIKVTNINYNAHIVQCITNGTINQQFLVYCGEDIGTAAAKMLLKEDLHGNVSRRTRKVKVIFDGVVLKFLHQHKRII